MQKVIREVDADRGIVQITVADERHYLKPSVNPDTGVPEYIAVPSVTWVAGYWPKGVGFYRWLADQGWDEAQALKQAAGDKGSRVHLAIEMILNGEEFRIDTKVADKSRSREGESYETELTYEELVCVQSFLRWRAETEQDYLIESLATEITIFSEVHGYAGTIDWVVRLTPKEGGKNPLKLTGPTCYIVDFKTSKQIWREYELQVSAYREAIINGENPIQPTSFNGSEIINIDLSSLRMAILQVGYDKNKAGYKFTEIEDAFDLFKVAQQIWKREVGDRTPGFTKRDFPIVLSPGKAAAAAPAGVAESAEIPLEIPEWAEAESVAVEPERPLKAGKKKPKGYDEEK